VALDDRFSRQFWWDLGDRLADRLTAGEKIEAVAISCARLAARRGDLFAREPTEEDVVFAASIMTWWPGKPDPAPHVEADLLNIRPRVFDEVSDRNLKQLDSLVPNRTLRMDFESLYAAQQQEIRAFLDVDKPWPPDDDRSQRADHPFGEAMQIPALQILAAKAFEPAIAGE
jgi:hypothetical protein